MPLDHFIPQVHLQKFYSPVLGDRLYATRKDNLKTFTPNSKAVCGINDGSTNAYLRENRAIEEFLRKIEPNYNSAVEKLIHNKIDNECIFTISGFVAYIITCSPGSMRIMAGPLKSSVENEYAMMDYQSLLRPPPPGLAGKNLSDLLRSGSVEVEIDPKYPQAIGISLIMKFVALFGNFKWEVLHNPFDDNPFFTSDFPAAIEKTGDPRILNRIVPLAPDLALRIMPNYLLRRGISDFSFTKFKARSLEVEYKEVLKLNCLIVRCAENTVFYRDDLPWVQPFIGKNRYYRIELGTQDLKTTSGMVHFPTQRIAERAPNHT